MRMGSGSKKRRGNIEKIVVSETEDVVYVDLVLHSMIKDVEKSYEENDGTQWNNQKNTHIFYLRRFYDAEKFKNAKTLGEDRQRYMDEIELYLQMKR